MGLKGDMADEAFSEGLLAIHEAALKYDPSREVPLVNWLGTSVRWSLRRWRDRQYRESSYLVSQETNRTVSANIMESNRLPESGETVRHVTQETLDILVDPLEILDDFRETINKIGVLLSPIERQVILAHACGYSGLEISKRLGIRPVQVSRLKNRAQQKLKEKW